MLLSPKHKDPPTDGSYSLIFSILVGYSLKAGSISIVFTGTLSLSMQSMKGMPILSGLNGIQPCQLVNHPGDGDRHLRTTLLVAQPTLLVMFIDIPMRVQSTITVPYPKIMMPQESNHFVMKIFH